MADPAQARVTILAEDGAEGSLEQFSAPVRAAVEAAGRHENLAFHVNVLLTDEQGIKDLNRSFRSVDRVTDVLSFPATSFAGHIRTSENAERDENGLLELGDIAICVGRAAAQAAELGHSTAREIMFLTLHGVLHLMGYDHETAPDEEVMTGLQRTIIAEIGAEQGGR